jgi:hypothetical protein
MVSKPWPSRGIINRGVPMRSFSPAVVPLPSRELPSSAIVAHILSVAQDRSCRRCESVPLVEVVLGRVCQAQPSHDGRDALHRLIVRRPFLVPCGDAAKWLVPVDQSRDRVPLAIASPVEGPPVRCALDLRGMVRRLPGRRMDCRIWPLLWALSPTSQCGQHLAQPWPRRFTAPRTISWGKATASCRWPGVNSSVRSFPAPAARRWTFVLKPPWLHPSALAAGSPV